MSLNVQSIRGHFPILEEKIDGHPLIYLDSAATAQKPVDVVRTMEHFYWHANGNAHRGMHVMAERATIALEEARAGVAKFIGAKHAEEIIFTKSCTEAINLVARSWGMAHLNEGDHVVLSIFEHHSNVVPWLQLKEEKGIEIDWIDIDTEGQLRLEQLDAFLKTGLVKLVAITAQSNVLGTRPPLHEIITKTHATGSLVLIDAAQYVAHAPIAVATESQFSGVDFLVFSGHKLYGPMGIGILYGKREHLERMPPFLGGGQMIQDVHKDRFTPADIPMRFEAGTQPIAEAVGLQAALKWLEQYSWDEILYHEQVLLDTAYQECMQIKNLRILGPTPHAKRPILGCFSFVIDGVHPHDLTEILGRKGICLRAGHHCAQPLHERLGITASTRLSVGIYNTVQELLMLRPSINEAIALLKK
jgi:cysteine desulfurase/selenocysteine lyase